ncbi:MAG: rod shape-determining protein MreC [Cocleimonas sp.]|nr:rod shape-determining protein MreC [Cocleimonas sp.]
MSSIIQNNEYSSLSFKFMLLAAISAAIMVLDYRETILHPVRTTLTVISYPFKYAINLPFSAKGYLTDYFSDHKTMAEENRQLRTTLDIYAARNQKYHAIADENLRLREQLNAIPKTDEKHLLAEILSVSANTFSRKVTINRGSNDHMYTGQVVIAGKNIYGQIDSIAPDSAEIMQLTDKDHAIHVVNTSVLNRKPELAIDEVIGRGALAVGSGKTNLLELRNIEANVDIRKGDIYVSSGLGKLYPAGYPVAIVSSIKYNSGDSFMKVMAHTLTDFTQAREVLAIWHNKRAVKSKKEELTSQLKKNKATEKSILKKTN